jgi:spore coat polysaccharide biosynthesis protein SpsF
LAGKPVLGHVVERCRAVPGADGIVVATTTLAEDDDVAVCARDHGAEVFRGSAEDVLGRFEAAARRYPANSYVRITADCPLADPNVISAVALKHNAGDYDYTYNDVPRGFPRGYDVEVIRGKTLAWLSARCGDETSREHVTPYLRDHAEDFRSFKVEGERGADYSVWRLVLDEEEDLRLLRVVFERLGAKPLFGMADVVRLLAAEPGLAEMNRGGRQKVRPLTPRVE